jgi:hypothetical protein
VYAGLLILAAAGLIISMRHWRRYSLLYMLFAFSIVATVVFHVQTRFRWEVEPFLLIFAVLYVAALASALLRRAPSL